jgi:hypothetical protein
MGQITIEIPQRIKRTFRIKDKDFAKQILSELERETIQESSDANDDDVLGMWSDRKESAQEIAKKLRNGWDRSKRNG